MARSNKPDREDIDARVFDALELLLAGFESAAIREGLAVAPERLHAGLLSVILRVTFLVHAEARGLASEPTSIRDLHATLAEQARRDPESLARRFGAYECLQTRFRAVFARGGAQLFDPSRDPMLSGSRPPAIDDRVVHALLERLVGSPAARDDGHEVEQLGRVYEVLMGHRVVRVGSPAVRMGKLGVWIETASLRALAGPERKRWLREVCGFSPSRQAAIESALVEHGDDEALAEALAKRKQGRARACVGAGRLVLQPGEGRRRSGSHYTPRALTERVVRDTLAPILACLGPEPSEAQILALAICDPTMGCGAFLIEACRQLADSLVAVWTREGGLSSILVHHGDPRALALRLVAERCLYGVDKNPVAVELAKLSLWLLAAGDARPFAFVDHALRHGDSLIGLNLGQIASFDWREGPTLPTLAASRRSLAELRLIADLCVGAFFADVEPGERRARSREAERLRRRGLVERWLAGEHALEPELRAMAQAIRDRHAPFHWCLEFPELFAEGPSGRPDPLNANRREGAVHMQAIVGNPPFMAGRQISTALGDDYLAWLMTLHEKSHGNADLSAHFFRRCDALIGEHGAIGLIATNTIGEGDTRATGLQYLVRERGHRIHAAVRSIPWPVAGAVVTVSVVHLARGNPAAACPAPAIHSVDPRDPSRMITEYTATIDSRLRPARERHDPRRLASNVGLNFLGSKIYGQGFLLSSRERDELIARDPRNAERIFPYVGGEDINARPDQGFDRHVINFGDVDLDEARRWPDLLAIVEARVRPERERLKPNPDGVRLRQYWWQFFRHVAPLYAAMKQLDRVLVLSRVSKHLCLCFQPTDRVFSEATNVFPLAEWSAFAVLQSRVHEPWARRLSSSMKTDLRYSASDCFDTFAFPRADARTRIPALELAGRAFYEARARFMLDTRQGLTKTYNALLDSEQTDAALLELRRLNEAMDRAVLDAYGWSDLEVPSTCPRSQAEREARARFEDAVLERLYQLNAARAGDE
ncbi:type IIL restriction-modification enzyme MmeI [Nannocystaceae bacterium ST9]